MITMGKVSRVNCIMTMVEKKGKTPSPQLADLFTPITFTTLKKDSCNFNIKNTENACCYICYIHDTIQVCAPIRYTSLLSSSILVEVQVHFHLYTNMDVGNMHIYTDTAEIMIFFFVTFAKE